MAWEGAVHWNTFDDFGSQAKNIERSADALILAKKMNSKNFVFVSSVCVFEAFTSVKNGEFKYRAQHVYGSAKFAAETICKSLAQKYQISVNACWLPHIFGEGNKNHLISNLLIFNLLKGKHTPLVAGEYLTDWLYVKECVKGIYATAEKGKPMKSYYVGHRKLKPFKEWVKEARDIINPNVELHFGAYGADPEVDYSLVDLDALYRDTGFEAKEDFREAILNTAEWVKSLEW